MLPVYTYVCVCYDIRLGRALSGEKKNCFKGLKLFNTSRNAKNIFSYPYCLYEIFKVVFPWTKLISIILLAILEFSKFLNMDKIKEILNMSGHFFFISNLQTSQETTWHGFNVLYVYSSSWH